MLQDIASWKDLGEALESFATVLALIFGGLWTYLAFIRLRLALPRLEVSAIVQEATMAKCLLIRAQVSLRNTGNVVAASDRGEIRLRQVIPPPSHVEEAIRSGLDPVPADCAQVEWPMLAGRNWKWEKGAFEIEPGESDSLCADFFVPLQAQVVELYFFLANARKKNQNVGWTVSQLHHMSHQGGTNGKGRQEGEDHYGATEAATASDSAATTTATATTPRQGQEEVVSRRVTPASTVRPALPSAR